MERFLTTHAVAAARLTIFFIFAYSPAYNIGYNALTYTYMVELFPYAQRARGLALFQFWGRGAGFFTTFVNPIGLERIEWRWLLTYCCWIAFEIVVVYLFFPETSGRTLEELAFCKNPCTSPLCLRRGGADGTQCSRTSSSQTRLRPRWRSRSITRTCRRRVAWSAMSRQYLLEQRSCAWRMEGTAFCGKPYLVL